MMTAKDFEAIARAVALHAPGNVPLADALAQLGVQSNPRFDRARFLAACDPMSQLDTRRVNH